MYFYIQLEEPEFSENKTTYMKIKKKQFVKTFSTNLFNYSSIKIRFFYLNLPISDPRKGKEFRT